MGCTRSVKILILPLMFPFVPVPAPPPTVVWADPLLCTIGVLLILGVACAGVVVCAGMISYNVIKKHKEEVDQSATTLFCLGLLVAVGVLGVSESDKNIRPWYRQQGPLNWSTKQRRQRSTKQRRQRSTN